MTMSDIHIRCDRCGNCFPQDPYHEGYPKAHMCEGSVRTVSYFEQVREANKVFFQVQAAQATSMMGMRVRVIVGEKDYRGIVLLVSVDYTTQQILMSLTDHSTFDFTAAEMIVIEG